MTAPATAALRLRGRDGPLSAQITWPEGEPEAVVVCLGEGASPPDEPLEAVVLRVRCATRHDARIAIEWTEAHARELGVPSGRVVVVGSG
jgi:hypothetical protein